MEWSGAQAPNAVRHCCRGRKEAGIHLERRFELPGRVGFPGPSIFRYNGGPFAPAAAAENLSDDVYFGQT